MALVSSAHAQQQLWSSNDCWQVDVAAYGQTWVGGYSHPDVEAAKEIPWIESNYRVQIRALGSVASDGIDCWRLEYAAPEASSSVVRAWVVHVDVAKDDGAAVGVRQVAGSTVPLKLRVISGIPLVSGSHALPLEQIPDGQALVRTNRTWSERSKVLPAWRAESSDAMEDGKRVRTLILMNGTVTSSVIRQVWTPGEKWWDSFTRHVQGHIDLEARRVP